ncbi:MULTISPECIES: hypothetical protein [unclassified Pseudomonas]|uniref:hypothetical protein n=1 Tax=unclassified Pseudomonas TaxID=196821 RepID=UPI00244BDEF2|nr:MULTISPECIES: hypothetical protein [unclassified Pseudomonas]MDG9923315.1 hypothetical protein [Pseudomonas sp. GD04045]MDH0034608.1 hypothetical protein [Pseudomonas sp. GD04019]
MLKEIISAAALAASLLMGSSASADNKDEVLDVIANAQEVKFFSLSPADPARYPEGTCVGDCYLGWPALGHAKISGQPRQRVLEHLHAWAEMPQPPAIAGCFSPRHGVSVQAMGHTYDFIVCYECGHAEVRKDSIYLATLYSPASSDQFEKEWDAILSAHNLPLAED